MANDRSQYIISWIQIFHFASHLNSQVIVGRIDLKGNISKLKYLLYSTLNEMMHCHAGYCEPMTYHLIFRLVLWCLIVFYSRMIFHKNLYRIQTHNIANTYI